jgi:hypothetical protein
VCNGRGYTYENPVEDTVLVMSLAYNKEFEEMAGLFDAGDAVMTVPYEKPVKDASGMIQKVKNPIFEIGMYDLVTLLDDEVKTSEILIKGIPIYARPADTLLNGKVVSVRSIRKVDSLGEQLVFYTNGIDYTLGENGLINWLPDGNSPLDGEQYTVCYTHRPVYTVLTSLPTPRHQDGQNLPKKVVLRYRASGFDKR